MARPVFRIALHHFNRERNAKARTRNEWVRGGQKYESHQEAPMLIHHQGSGGDESDAFEKGKGPQFNAQDGSDMYHLPFFL